MNGILMALFGTLGTFLITALGAAGIFFVRREVSGNLQILQRQTGRLDGLS